MDIIKTKKIMQWGAVAIAIGIGAALFFLKNLLPYLADKEMQLYVLLVIFTSWYMTFDVFMANNLSLKHWFSLRSGRALAVTIIIVLSVLVAFIYERIDHSLLIGQIILSLLVCTWIGGIFDVLRKTRGSK